MSMQSATTNRMTIKTPEGIMFSLRLAGPAIRFLAWGIDFACLGVLTLVAGVIAGVFRVLSPGLAMALFGSWVFVMPTVYSVVFEWLWRGQTIGKRILRIRVMDEQGLKLQFSQIVLRNLLRYVDRLPFFYLLGATICWMSRRSQRLGDYAAGTIVVRTPKLEQPDLNQIMAGKYNSLREHAHLAAVLRQRVSPEEAQIALSALLRRDELEPQARIDLFTELAAHFREKATFPEEATQGVADEQYIRNVVDLVFRPHTTGEADDFKRAVSE